MLDRIKQFFFGKVVGRALARVAVSAVSGAAAFLAGHGLELTPEQQAQGATLIVSGANALWTMLSDWRARRAAEAAAKAAAKSEPAK